MAACVSVISMRRNEARHSQGANPWTSRSLRAGSRLTKIHQFPDGTIVEMLNTHIALEFLDRNLAGEAVIGAVKADQPGDDPLQKRHAVSENGLQDGLLALE